MYHFLVFVEEVLLQLGETNGLSEDIPGLAWLLEIVSTSSSGIVKANSSWLWTAASEGSIFLCALSTFLHRMMSYSPGEYDEKMTAISNSVRLDSFALSMNNCSRAPNSGSLKLGSLFLDMQTYNKPIVRCHSYSILTIPLNDDSLTVI